MTRPSHHGPLVAALVLLLCLLAWDAAGSDLALARVFGTPAGFRWRGDARLMLWMHELPRFASWAGLAALVVLVRWPAGPWRRLDVAGRSQIALSAFGSVAIVSLLKTLSTTSCPWDLQAFGGMAQHVSHWRWGQADGGPGRCFPAGHASAALAYLGGWFAWRRVSPRLARCWLAASVVLGLALGLAQQVRGAHYASHTFWTVWICWSVGLALDAGVRCWRRISVTTADIANMNRT